MPEADFGAGKNPESRRRRKGARPNGQGALSRSCRVPWLRQFSMFKNKRYERMEKKRIKEEAKAQKKKEKEEKKNPSSSSKTKISLPDWLTK